jgi:hypothetical protein
VLIACNAFRLLEAARPSLAPFLTSEWTRLDLRNTGHWPMFSKPVELVELLVR